MTHCCAQNITPGEASAGKKQRELPAPAFLADVLEQLDEKTESPAKSNRNRRKRSKKPAAQRCVMRQVEVMSGEMVTGWCPRPQTTARTPTAGRFHPLRR